MSTDCSTQTLENDRRVSDYWGKQFEEMREDQYYWLNNAIVTDHTYRLMTGTPKHWLPWLFHDYFRDVERFDRVLSVCCGDGAHELAMFQTGKVGTLRSFDLSEGAIRQAAARFDEAGIPPDRYRFEVQDANRVEIDGTFDLVVSAGAVHHVTELEALLAQIRRMTAPAGRFVLVEFVGPNRFQWTDRQVELINRIVGRLDPVYLRDGRRAEFNRLTIEEMLRIDPSEAVRSEDILGLVDREFEVEYRRDFHGTLMHQLYPLLNARLANGGNPDFDSIIRMTLLLESELIASGALSSDFAFLVCRPRT